MASDNETMCKTAMTIGYQIAQCIDRPNIVFDPHPSMACFLEGSSFLLVKYFVSHMIILCTCLLTVVSLLRGIRAPFLFSLPLQTAGSSPHTRSRSLRPSAKLHTTLCKLRTSDWERAKIICPIQPQLHVAKFDHAYA